MNGGVFLLLAVLLLATYCTHGFKPHVHDKHVISSASGVEVWAYVEVRPGAHMFWWLYYTYHPDGYQNRPIMLWLQGGPGSSSCGYGNFELIGPLDLELKPRNHTWVNGASILFVDQPVGTGYSYVDDVSLLTTTTDEIADDLYTCIKAFLDDIPEFKTIPFWIFGESYGGKMGVATAKRIMEGVAAADIDLQFKGFAMGNAWIAPAIITTDWAPWLYYLGNVDDDGYNDINNVAQQCNRACENGEWQRCTDLWVATEIAVLRQTDGIDFYNVLKYTPSTQLSSRFTLDERGVYRNKNGRPLAIDKHIYDLLLGPEQFDALDDLMNNEIRAKLQIIPANVTWGGQSDLVFEYQNVAFMQPVYDLVGQMAQDYPQIDNVVYEGQLDLICLNKGAMDWVQLLPEYWDGYTEFWNATRSSIANPADLQIDLYVKVHQNFKYYWVMNAGHMVPKDNPWGGYELFTRVIEKTDV